MTTSSSASACAAIPSASSSNLSPHAAPFALPARPARAPPGRLQDVDVSRSPPTACFGTKSCDTALPASTSGAHTSQPRSWPGICGDAAYPSSICSTSGIFSDPSVMMISNNQKDPLNPGKGTNRSKCSTVKIESPQNKTSETNNITCGLMIKSSITKVVTKSDEGIKKNASFPKSLEVSNLADGNGISQDAMICSKEAIPVSHMNPLAIPTMCADPSDSVADGVKPDPSECSVDSPCWRGASVSHLSSFDVLQTSAPQSINEEPETFGDEQKESTTIVQHYEALEALQNFDQSHSQSHLELGMSMKSGDIGKNKTKESHEKGLESAKQCAAKCTAEQKTSLGIRESSMKRSGLNSAAPDFIPSSVGKLKISEGSCSSAGSNISGILKAMENLSEMLRNSYFFDEIELEEHDHTIIRSVIENLQTCLHKTRKGPIKDGASNKAGLRAPHSQTTVLKSDAGNYNGSYTANGGGNSITNNNFAGTSHVLNDFGKNSLHWSQPSVNSITRRISCEEGHSQILIYKNLWIDAERANCELKYLLKHTRMKTGPESGMAHVGGPRNPSSHSCNFGSDCSYTCGAAISRPPTLCFPKGHPTEETSIVSNTDLLYPGDGIQLGDDGVFSCSARTDNHPIQAKNFQGGLVLANLEETSMHHHAHPAPQLAPSRAHRELKRSTMDQASGSSCIAGVDSILHGNSEYGLSSDWEHVLKEEIGWS